MSRYIDADKLHEEIFEETKFKLDPETNDVVKRLTMSISEVLRRINNQPSADVVKIIRCKNCKHWICNPNTDAYGVCGKASYDDFEIIMENDDYCSYGEKR